MNRLTRLSHGQNQLVEDYQYSFNDDDEITSITSLFSAQKLPPAKNVTAADSLNRISQFGAANFAFNPEGEITTKTDEQGATGYHWDARGRLKQVTLPTGQIVSYEYDALGRRTSRTGGGVTTNFLYDGNEVVIDRSSDGTTVDYLNGPGVDNKLRQTSATTGSLYFIQDHLGSTVALTNASGTVVERLQYEASGDSTGSGLTRYGYSGRERDPLTGLIYNRARWYDPQQGRFMSEDPTGFRGGLNLYAYAENNPIMYSDPLGLEPECPVDPCDQLRQLIKQLRDELVKRAHDLRMDPHGLPATGTNSIAGHKHQFIGKQRALRKALNEFNSRGCGGGIPGDAWNWASVPVPEKMPETNDERRMREKADYHRNIAIGAGAVGLIAIGVVVGPGVAIGLAVRGGLRLALAF